MVLESGSDMIILDAGSGLIELDAQLRTIFPEYPNKLPFQPNLLLSHLHLDHILGLIWFSPIWNEDNNMRIFSSSRDGRPLKEQVFGTFVPPYWPVDVAKFSQVQCHEITGPFKIGSLTITPFAANHPDNTLSFHITDGQKTLVYSLDNEMPENCDKAALPLTKYCQDADLVIFDASYLQADYQQKRGWGHSTVQDGLKLAAASGCKRLMFAHYGHEYSDKDLDSLQELITDHERFIFAHEGMEIEI